MRAPLPHPGRRAWLRWLGACMALPGLAAADPADEPVRHGRTLRFPRDHGAHLRSRVEWWYVTGWLDDAAARRFGFQVTFFRSRSGVAEDLPGRFAPRQILFAHAALSDLQAARHRHAQRIARWSGAPDAALARAALADCDLRCGGWTMRRQDSGGASRYDARFGDRDAGFELDLRLAATQPLLLQGDAGHSRKGPRPEHASHYVSEPQLQVAGTLALDARARPVQGRAWFDHEWSDEYLASGGVGWDWIGINLDDGSALMAFRIRRADGSALWAGATLRRRGEAARSFGPGEVRFVPGRRWTSPASGATYPVQWRIECGPAAYELRALLDAQELDSRASTGALYWEGLSELRDAASGRHVGLGYLEMTGYAGALNLGG